MKSCLIRIAALIAMTTAPAFAQDHSQHGGSPLTGTPREAKKGPENDEHAQHADARPTTNSEDQESFRSEERHIPPDPPAHPMPDMSARKMRDLMDMDDAANVGQVLVDQLEGYREPKSTALAWDAQAWYGNDYNKVWIKTEGERVHGQTNEAEAELLWNRVFARWWSVQTGIRHDFGEGPERTWGAIGIDGLAPYWFDVEATLYVGESSRAAARVKVEYEALFTQRLILQPEIEANLYSKADPDRGIGAGFSKVVLGLRLRYEFRREVAPYIGVSFTRSFGDTADFARAASQETSDVRAVAGVRLWF